MKPLDSNRLIFRELRPSDEGEFYVRAFGASEVMKYLQWDSHDSLEQTRCLIREMSELHKTGEKFFWTAQRKADDAIIGLASLKPDQETVWIGFLILSGEHRKGYGSEIVSALEELVLRDYASVSAAVEDSNLASINLLQQADWVEYEEPSQESLKTFRKHSANKSQQTNR